MSDQKQWTATGAQQQAAVTPLTLVLQALVKTVVRRMSLLLPRSRRTKDRNAETGRRRVREAQMITTSASTCGPPKRPTEGLQPNSDAKRATLEANRIRREATEETSSSASNQAMPHPEAWSCFVCKKWFQEDAPQKELLMQCFTCDRPVCTRHSARNDQGQSQCSPCRQLERAGDEDDYSDPLLVAHQPDAAITNAIGSFPRNGHN